MPTRANRDTNSYGMKVGNGAQAPHTEIEDRICPNIIYLHTYTYTYTIYTEMETLHNKVWEGGENAALTLKSSAHSPVS